MLAPDGVIVISVPNVRYHEVVRMLVSGAWTYMDAGIMDATHLRFFTRSSFKAVVEEAGLEVAALRPLNIYDAERLPREADGSLKLGKAVLHGLDDAAYEEFLCYQWLVCACKPGLDRLAEARRALEANENEAAFSHAVDAVGVDECERRRIMAKALARTGQLEKAEAVYREALEMGADAETRGDFGILLVGMNRIKEALPHLEFALAAHGKNDRVRGALGLAHLGLGQHQAAFELLLRAAEASYERINLLPPLLQAAENAGHLAQAAQLVQGFSDFYPGNFDLACTYAQLLAQLGRREEAIARVESVLAFDPAHARANALREELGGAHT